MLYILQLNISFHRSMRNPFQHGFSTKLVVFITILAYVVACLINYAEFYFVKYKPYPGHTQHHYCYWKGSSILLFTVYLKNSLLISFIPLPILVALHFLSYKAILKSAQQFNMDNNRLKTMKQVRKTFFVVIVIFFCLTVPTEIQTVVVVAFWNFKQDMLPPVTLLVKLATFFDLLHSFNSCANPFIYAKIHKKLSKIPQKIQTFARRRRNRERQEPNVIELLKCQHVEN